MISESFNKTIIHNYSAMTYEDAQQILDGKIESKKEIYDSLVILDLVSQQLRNNRFEKGALNLASPEVK